MLHATASIEKCILDISAAVSKLCWIIMASKVLVVSVILLFSIAVVGAIPKYGLRSENQDGVNCTDAYYQVQYRNVCGLYRDFISDDYLSKVPSNVTEDLYSRINQQLTALCASRCKSALIAYYKCFYKVYNANTFINYFTCGKINQEYCYVHLLRGTTAGTIVTYETLWNNCPYYNVNSSSQYCVGGVCQRNVIQWVNYMGCCAGSVLHPSFNLTSCGITDTTPCSSGTVAISSSVFIMIAMAIIQMYWM